MTDADCTPGREPRSVAASFFLHFGYAMICDELTVWQVGDVTSWLAAHGNR